MNKNKGKAALVSHDDFTAIERITELETALQSIDDWSTEVFVKDIIRRVL